MPREGGGDGRAVDALARAHRAAQALVVPLEDHRITDGTVGAIAAARVDRRMRRVAHLLDREEWPVRRCDELVILLRLHRV